MNEPAHIATIAALFAIIIVCAFIIAAPLIKLTRAKSVSEPARPSLPLPVSSVASTVDISTWKTYRNEAYGFELKHPDDIGVQQVDAEVPEAFPILIFRTFYQDRENSIVIEVHILQEWLEGTMREAVGVVSEKDVVIGGVIGKRISGVDQRGISRDEVWIQHREKMYLLRGQEPFFSQILSTFKFIPSTGSGQVK